MITLKQVKSLYDDVVDIDQHILHIIETASPPEYELIFSESILTNRVTKRCVISAICRLEQCGEYETDVYNLLRKTLYKLELTESRLSRGSNYIKLYNIE